MSIVYPDAASALADVLFDGMTLAVGGFGLSGVPVDLIEAVRDSGVKDLTVVSNNMGIDGKGLGILLEGGQVRKVIASYVGENALFAQQYLSGALDIEFNPQAPSPSACEPAEPESPPSTPPQVSAPRSPRVSRTPISTDAPTFSSAASLPMCRWCVRMSPILVATSPTGTRPVISIRWWPPLGG